MYFAAFLKYGLRRSIYEYFYYIRIGVLEYISVYIRFLNSYAILSFYGNSGVSSLVFLFPLCSTSVIHLRLLLVSINALHFCTYERVNISQASRIACDSFCFFLFYCFYIVAYMYVRTIHRFAKSVRKRLPQSVSELQGREVIGG